MRSIHPFPARMAPEIAMKYLDHLPKTAVVCDPMTGSGTVAALAAQRGLRVIAYDVDPLAALMTTVRCTQKRYVNQALAFWSEMQQCMKRGGSTAVPWIDSCEETKAYVDYWFGPTQQCEMRRAARFLSFSKTSKENPQVANIIRLALSRIVIQKTRGASLAWDVSHSRPHRVHDPKTYDYSVADALEKSVARMVSALSTDSITSTSRVRIGDARYLAGVRTMEVDAIVTSPPYLNAIDYLRGHRLSLVWLGLSIPQLRTIRSDSVGTEARLRTPPDVSTLAVLKTYPITELSGAQLRMVTRYSNDLVSITASAHKVLKPGGTATYVIGNNVLSGVDLFNSKALTKALEIAGFDIENSSSRDIPSQHRYLPINVKKRNALSKRMAQEIVIHARKAS